MAKIYRPKPQVTIILVVNEYCMTTTMLTTFNKTLINILMDQPFEHITIIQDALVLCDWPINCKNNLKLIPPPMETLIY